MAFQKGQSGNPGGRPKEAAEVKALAREYGAEAIEKLVTLLRGDDARVAKAAADSLLDRGFGKPGQSIDLVAEVNATVQAIERRIVKAE
jgi:hypothetical protein